MRVVISSLLFMAFAWCAPAAERAELDGLVRKLMFKLETLQTKADKRVPAHSLRQAQGIILLDRTKVGFLFAYQGGSGLVMARDAKTGGWSPPAFVNANEASLGFQIGGQKSFVAILLMNTNVTKMVAEGSFEFGGEAGGTAGKVSGGTKGTISTVEPLLQVYSDRRGLYGGAALKGDALSPNTDANITYYGAYLTLKEILFEHKVKASEAATELAHKLDEFAKE
jgi:SH3 domain-containing YSC84-like protein 1